MPDQASGVEWIGGSSSEKSTLTVAAGVIAATLPYHLIASETGTSDDLDRIIPDLPPPGDEEGYLVAMRPEAGHTITVRHNQAAGQLGNILIPGQADLLLTESEVMYGIFDFSIGLGTFLPIAPRRGVIMEIVFDFGSDPLDGQTLVA